MGMILANPDFVSGEFVIWLIVFFRFKSVALAWMQHADLNAIAVASSRALDLE
ncbi:hypothetical protein [Planktotalea sp.]|uniref:hypothetical protein n=1 Tax=Planktotalea sp. TaxID=2029877 RepID=UPI0035C81599